MDWRIQRWAGMVTRFGCAGMILLVSSCLPDPLEVDSVPEAPPQLVVSTQIVPDQSLLVLVTRTFGALEASGDSDPEDLLDYIAVDDALVILRGPDRTDTLQSFGKGTYGGIIIPFEAGQIYDLDIRSAALGQVHATAEVKPRVAFEHAEAELLYNGYGDTLAQITYALADKEEKNWYMINVQEVEREDAIENLLNPRAFTLLLDDGEFNGKRYGEQFTVFPRDYNPGDTVAISLSNISEEYYQFMKLRVDNRLSLVDFVSEPVDYPSNIIGGRGYFNLYVPDVRFFVFD